MKLICIYNADSGILNGALDSLHKFISPVTYSCKLCSLTHGYFGAKQEWTRFLERFPHEIVFLHRDEIGDIYKNLALPCIVEEGRNIVVVRAEEFAKIRSVEELIEKLSIYTPHV